LDEKGVPYRTQVQRDQQEDNVWRLHNQANLWRNHSPKIEGSYEDGWPTNISDVFGERETSIRQADRELWEAYGVSSNPELMDLDPRPNPVWFPAWQIPLPDGSDAQIGWKRAEDAYKKHLPKIIMANPGQFEALWKEYIDELNKSGLDKYEAYMQQEINKRIAKWSPKN